MTVPTVPVLGGWAFLDEPIEPWTRTHIIGVCAIVVTTVVALCAIYLSAAFTKKKIVATLALLTTAFSIAYIISPQLRSFIEAEQKVPNAVPPGPQKSPEEHQFSRQSYSSTQSAPAPSPPLYSSTQSNLKPTPSYEQFNSRTPPSHTVRDMVDGVAKTKLKKLPPENGKYYILLTNDTDVRIRYGVWKNKWVPRLIEPHEFQWVEWEAGYVRHLTFMEGPPGVGADAVEWSVFKAVENRLLTEPITAANAPVYRLQFDGTKHIILREPPEAPYTKPKGIP
jgi:hypothetical protein